ncbi:MAG TPA: HU family DNA-binding protein [Balneolaceae bacterium]|nr:HU family DNA-binding protein [Balneolaceae bacterium]
MSEKITFKELVDLIAAQSNQSRNSTNSFIHELVDIIENGLKKSGSVSISGFGKFELRWMKPRTGVNPQTGEELSIPGQNKVVFKPYKNLREDVNKPFSHLESKVVGDSKDSSGSTPEKNDSKETAEGFDEDPFENMLNDSDWDSAFYSSEESDEKPEKSVEPNAAYSSVSSASASVDDLLIERENPRFSKEEVKHQKEDKITEKKESDKPSAIPNKEKIAEEVQKSGSFKWSYAAAVIIALLAFIILFFMIQRYQSDDTQTQQNQIEMATPAPDATDSNPAVTDDTEPDPPDVGTQSEFETSPLTVEPGQSLWTIAESELGNPYLWPVLYNLNRDVLDNPNQLPAASDIQIPDISDPENLNDFEREQVALGYFSLYEWNRANNPDEARFFLWAVGVFSPDLLDQPPADVDPDDLEFARNR